MAPALSAAPAESRGYITFLAGDGDYVKGVVALAKSLRRVKAAYPLVVAVLDDVPEEHSQLLRLHGCLVRPIEKIQLAGSERFEDFEKLVYLDADMAVYENIDHLLDLPHGLFYAVPDCFCECTWSHSLQYKVKYCQQTPDRNPWPHSLGSPPPKYFNAGMFVFEPSRQTFDQMMHQLLSTPLTPFAEQDSLNAFFNEIFSPLPLHYNLIMPMLWWHPDKVPELEKVKVVHYCAPGSKPWRFTGKEEHMDMEAVRRLVEKWWNVYEDKPMEYPALSHLMKKLKSGASNVPLSTLRYPKAEHALLISAKNAMQDVLVDACSTDNESNSKTAIASRCILPTA